MGAKIIFNSGKNVKDEEELKITLENIQKTNETEHAISNDIKEKTGNIPLPIPQDIDTVLNQTSNQICIEKHKIPSLSRFKFPGANSYVGSGLIKETEKHQT